MKVVIFTGGAHFEDVKGNFNSVEDAQRDFCDKEGAYVDKFGFIHKTTDDNTDNIVAYFFDDCDDCDYYGDLTGIMGEILDDSFNGEPIPGGTPDSVRRAAEDIDNLALPS